MRVLKVINQDFLSLTVPVTTIVARVAQDQAAQNMQPDL